MRGCFDHPFERPLYGPHELAHLLGDLLLDVLLTQRLGAAEPAFVAFDDLQRDFSRLAFLGRFEGERRTLLL